MRIQGSLLTQCILLLALCTVFSTASHDGDAVERKTLSASSNSKDLYIPGGKSSWCRECTRCDTNSKKSTPACKRACAKCPKNLILEAQQDITLAAPDDINLEAQEDINLEAKKNLILSALEDLTLEAQKDLILQAHEHINLEAKKNLILSALEDLTLEAQKNLLLEAQESIGVRLKDKTLIEITGDDDFSEMEISSALDVIINGYLEVNDNLYVDGDFDCDAEAFFFDKVRVFDDLKISRGTLIFDGPLVNYKVDPIVFGEQTCTCDGTGVCTGTASNGTIALGSDPKTLGVFGGLEYFPIVCKCGEVGVCGWYSFTAICPENVVTNDEFGGAEVEELDIFPGRGWYDIQAPTFTDAEDVWVYIYFRNEGSDPLSYTQLSYTFSTRYDGDTSFPFYTVTASDPGNPDFVLDFDFEAAAIPTDPNDFFSSGNLNFDVPAGQYYLFGIYKKAGDGRIDVDKGADLSVGPGLPSCATDGGVHVQAKSTNKIKTKRAKPAKRAKRTRPPTKMATNKPSHA